MDLRHNMLYWGGHPSRGFHRRLEGEQIVHLPQYATLLSAPSGKTCLVQTIFIT